MFLLLFNCSRCIIPFLTYVWLSFDDRARFDRLTLSPAVNKIVLFEVPRLEPFYNVPTRVRTVLEVVVGIIIVPPRITVEPCVKERFEQLD